MTSHSLALLDEYYARSLGGAASDLNSAGVSIVAGPELKLRYAKGSPLAVYALGKENGCLVSVRFDLAGPTEAVAKRCGDGTLCSEFCDAVEAELARNMLSPRWFRGQRLYCEQDKFVDHQIRDVETVTESDDHGVHLHHKWNGEVFGQIDDGQVVSWAAVKPLSDIIWDLSVETLPDYRGMGYGKSVVSAAMKHIFDNGKMAGWGTDLTNTGSLKIARAVGFEDYCLDFGCVEGK